MNLEGLYKPNCIRTFSGKYVDILNPTADMICKEDIAHALAHQCRFAGHLSKFYSVAEHCINVAMRAPNHLKRQGLFHDGGEPYLVDVPTPVKVNLPGYKEIEHNLMLVIAAKFEFEWPMSAEIAAIDKEMLELEYHCLMLQEADMPDYRKVLGTSGCVKTDFLNYYTTITGDTSWQK